MADLILYTSDDGQTRVTCRFTDGSVWLTQALIADLYGITVPTVNEHLKGIYADNEVPRDATFRSFRIVRSEGGREVAREIGHYSLPAILAVGYRVRSPRGTQFRQWATAHLAEFLVKGFVMDDERLKDPAGWDHFDELLERIREIRASEKRFYQKVRDLFALSSDYAISVEDTQRFFARVQNKLLFAATGHTAAELVVKRANPDAPNMDLTSWTGTRVRKQDVIVAKNYLTQDEIDTLNRLVVIFLEQAMLRVKSRNDLTLDYWKKNVDDMLLFNDQPVLDGAGSVSHDDMKRTAHARFDTFDQHRRAAEARDAEAQDLREIEAMEDELKKKRPPRAQEDDESGS